MAKNSVVVTEDDLEQVLRDDPEFGFALLNSEFRENIWRYIWSICRYFTDEDVHDVCQVTLLEFARCMRKPGFDPTRPMRLVQRIARFRALDRARKKYGSRITDSGPLIEQLAIDLKDTKVNLEWRLILKEEWPRFRAALDQAIDDLPPKQQAAALAFLEVYQEVRAENSYRPLADRIREMTGDDCTTVQARDNWRAAKKSIEAKLRRAKFHLLEEE